MKKIILSLLLIGVNNSIFGQASAPIGNAWAAPKFLGFDASNGTNPLFFRTNNTNRMKFNGNLSYMVNGFNDVRNGYMLLSPLQNGSLSNNTGLIMDNNRGAFSMLHLNGATASNAYQEYGYRPWMKTGITLTGNRDLSYFGLRALGTGEDITETTIAWSDNADLSNPGPDDMVLTSNN